MTYTATFGSSAVDIFEILPETDSNIYIHEFSISQLSGSFGNTNEMYAQLAMKQGQTISGNGTSAASAPRDIDDAASHINGKTYSTTRASGGIQVIHYSWCWNTRIPFSIVWSEDSRPYMKGARRMTIELSAALPRTIECNTSITWSEFHP